MEESILFLSTYMGPYMGGEPWDGENVVGESLKDINQEATAKLKRLGEINLEREEIINYFKNQE